MDRRKFLGGMGAGTGLAVGGGSLIELLEAFGGGRAGKKSPVTFNTNKGGTITFLGSTSYVPVADQLLNKEVKKWSSQHKGWDVVLDLVSGDSLQVKISSALESRSGPDVLGLGKGSAWLYEASLIDHGSIVKRVEKANGSFYPYMVAYNKVRGVWRAVPSSVSVSAWTYRKDIWGLVGKADFVNTYADLLKYGKQLVAMPKGLPVGVALGNASGDSQAAWYPVLWGFGGQEVDKDGKSVAIQSDATRNALEWAAELYNSNAILQKCLAWASGASNNLAWNAETISATTNGPSIYTDSLPGGPSANPTLAQNTGVQIGIAGPKRRVTIQGGGSWAITKWSKNQNAAGEVIEWLMQKENFADWISNDEGTVSYPGPLLNGLAVWKKDPALSNYNKSSASSLWPGWPAPPNRAAQNVYNQFVIVNMFAQAVQNPNNIKSIMSTAAQQLQQTYGAPS